MKALSTGVTSLFWRGRDKGVMDLERAGEVLGKGGAVLVKEAVREGRFGEEMDGVHC